MRAGALIEGRTFGEDSQLDGEREVEVAVGPMRSKRGQWPTPCQGAPSSMMQVQLEVRLGSPTRGDGAQLSQSAT